MHLYFRSQGFTLIEVLLVVSVVGILLAVLFSASLRGLRMNQLREGAVQLATDLERARTVAQRDSRDSTVSLVSTSATAPGVGYSLTLSGTTVNYTLPHGVRVARSNSSSPHTVTFNAPHGTLGANGVVWVVSSPRMSDVLYVKTVGVTGKVALSATY